MVSWFELVMLPPELVGEAEGEEEEAGGGPSNAGKRRRNLISTGPEQQQGFMPHWKQCVW